MAERVPPGEPLITIPGLKAKLASWRWLLLFMVMAQLLRLQVSAFLPLAAPSDLLEESDAWTPGPGTALRFEGATLRVGDRADSDPSRAFASRLIPVKSDADMLRVMACLAPGQVALDDARREVALLLASERGGKLDFNRSYLLPLRDARSGCISGYFPRRPGDDRAVLQLQLGPLPPVGEAGDDPGAARGGEDSKEDANEDGSVLRELALNRLEILSLKEDRTWRWQRRAMLVLGIVLIAVRFTRLVPLSEIPLRPPSPVGMLRLLGLGTVGAIVFGCTVSVPLKADIYQFMTGGRVLPASGSQLGELLLTAFPLGGFSIFTFLHAVLFAIATAAFGLAGLAVTADLLLLGALTETLQIFVPGRGPGIDDVLVDWSGVALAALLVVLLRRSQRVRLLLKEQGVDEDVPRL